MKFSLGLVAALLVVVVPAMGIELLKVNMPTHPKYSFERWAEILNNQTFKEEVCIDCKPGTKPQHPRAGYVRDISTQIVNGNRARPGQFPYQVGITLDGSYFCGGSVISEHWVLTAGVCVDSIRRFSIVFGTLEPLGDRGWSSIKRTSTNGILHPQYVRTDDLAANDIAVIGMRNGISFSSMVSPITLATDANENNVGKVATISGWGKTSDNSPSISENLNYVAVAIIDNSQGAVIYGDTVTDKNIVTDGSKREADCGGDTGGPLTIAVGSNKVKQVGLLSFGSDAGCSAGYPSVYTKVASYIKWLEDTTGIKFEDDSATPPATSTAPPATSTTLPATSTTLPATSTTPPATCTCTAPPATSTATPATSTATPATSTAPLATSTAPLATSTAPPATSNAPPATSNTPTGTDD